MGKFSKTRVEAFSDGVFAIIVTLLVLEIKVPNLPHSANSAEIMTALVPLLPKFFGWVISFFTLCVIWVNHHRVFESVETVTPSFFWLNALLLFWCSFIPFPTALMGDFPHQQIAVALYGAVMAMMALSFFLLRLSIARQRGGEKMYTAIARHTFMLGFLPYAGATALAWVSPFLATVVYAAIPVYFMLNSGRRKPV